MSEFGGGRPALGTRGVLALITLIAISVSTAGPAAGHTGAPVQPDRLWAAWSWEPGVLLGIGVAAWLYARGARRLWRRAGIGRGIPRWRFHCFAAGLLALFAALVSPLDALGSALFSAHMVQHEVLIFVAAPLLVLGSPAIGFLWALPMRWRMRLGRVARVPPVHRLTRAIGHPATAWLVYASALWVWHAPALYQATLTSEPAHLAQHVSFLGSAILFWWVLLDVGRSRRRRYGFGVIYIFTTAVHGSILGALLTFAREPWYPAYAPRTAAWGLSPLEDQQLGGMIMWIPPGFVYTAAAIAVLGLWLRAIEARNPRRAVRVTSLEGSPHAS